MRRFGLLLALFCISTPFIASAQALPGISSPITITTTPATAEPNTNAHLQAQSSSFDVDTASITWTVNGKVVAQGVGDKALDVQVGALGKETDVELTASTPDGQTFSATTSINPSQIGLVWEASTYTPPFYKGRALRSWGASYKVVAIPQVVVGGATVNPSSLIYTWSKNNSVDGDSSGYGKYTYAGDSSISYTHGGDDISVSVATSNGTKIGEASISVPVTQAQMFMYQESPIYGVLYNQAVADMTLTGDSISLHAEPFFFSDIQNTIGSLVWTVNGNTVPNFSGNPSISLARQDKGAGTSVISASLQSPSALLQAAAKSVTININAEQ